MVLIRRRDVLKLSASLLQKHVVFAMNHEIRKAKLANGRNLNMLSSKRTASGLNQVNAHPCWWLFALPMDSMSDGTEGCIELQRGIYRRWGALTVGVRSRSQWSLPLFPLRGR